LFNTYLNPAGADHAPSYRRDTGHAGFHPDAGCSPQKPKGQTMKTKLALSAIALLAAAPAFASSTQLELSAGVPAGVYTVAQAGEIASAETAADALRLKKFYAAQNTGEVARSDFSVDAAAATVRLGGSDRR